MASNMYTMINIRFNKYYIHLHNKSPGINLINSPSILVICAQYYAAFNEEQNYSHNRTRNILGSDDE